MAGPRALYLEIARLTTRSLVRTRRAGRSCASTWRPMVPTRSTSVPVMTPAARTIWSRAAARAVAKAARSGSVPEDGIGGVGHRGP